MERMSPESLIQLLDGLEADCVFNRLEKEAILEENQTTANKARHLIDDVMKKGEKACMKMIEHLHNNNSTLASHLRVSFIQVILRGKATYF